jgi:hypothetical protein
MRALRFFLLGVFVIAGGSGCEHGYTPPSSSNAAFTVTSGGSAVSSIKIVGSGTSATIDVSERGYTGSFTATSSNTGVVTVAAEASSSSVRADTLGTGATGDSFTLTAVSGGTATITITDSNQHSTSISVGVTATEGVVY